MGWGGGDGCMVIYGAPRMHNMPSLSWAMHVYVLGRHVHCVKHYGTVMSWGRLCLLLPFTRVYYLVYLFDWIM